MKKDQRDWVHQVYDQHAPDLYRLARHRLGDPDLAYDMVQEVFLVLVDRAEDVRSHPNLMAWLITTLKKPVSSFPHIVLADDFSWAMTAVSMTPTAAVVFPTC